MPLEIAKHLHDVLAACELISDFTRGKSFTDYQAESLLRAGVEREFITVGEALTQAEKIDSDSVRSITALRQIIGFRNLLVHAYSVIDHATVWGVVENDLPLLKEQTKELLTRFRMG